MLLALPQLSNLPFTNRFNELAETYFMRLLVSKSNKPVALQQMGRRTYKDADGRQLEAYPHQTAMHLAVANGQTRIVLALLRQLQRHMKVGAKRRQGSS